MAFDPTNPFTFVVPAEQHDAAIREASRKHQEQLQQRTAELQAANEKKWAEHDAALAIRTEIADREKAERAAKTAEAHDRLRKGREIRAQGGSAGQ
jgi:predicted metal-dependent hydrolase